MTNTEKHTVPQLTIITGVSGSGKSTALDAFEDMGFFCVNNLPAALVPDFKGFISRVFTEPSAPQDDVGTPGAIYYNKFALLVDCRESRSVKQVEASIKELRAQNIEVELLYLDCQDEVAIRRFQETRRPHPLLRDGDIEGGVRSALTLERGLLEPLRKIATKIIDTSSMSPHQLRSSLEEHVGHDRTLEVTLISFGFKYGVPDNLDLLVDVRFLPNPYFVPELKEKTGLDAEVKEFVEETPAALEFVERYLDLLQYLIPHYVKEGKHYLRVGIGCTGGRHRSVVISELLKEKLDGGITEPSVIHRDARRD